MKGLGLAGAGLGTAAATAPVFHDLDEVTSSAQGEIKHPWYVNKLDHENLTVEIDWGILQRYDARIRFQRINDEARALYQVARDLKSGGLSNDWMMDKFPTYKGPDLRTVSMCDATSATRLDYAGFDGSLKQVRGSRAGQPLNIPTPEDEGFTKWTGTPEENLRTLRSACRFFGASEIGVVEVTEKSKKLIYANDSSGKPLNFKSASVPEETDSEYIIPTSCRSVLFFSTLEATDQVKQAPAPTWSGYDHYSRVDRRINYFLGAMGYLHVDINRLSTSSAFGAMAGVVEHSRAGHIATSYKYGNMFRGMHRIVTDFPLPPTNPIDAGVAKFCENCKTCAESCPYEAMDLGDKSWEHSYPDDNRLGCLVQGYKGWRTSVLKCPKCKNCHTTCPFNAADDAIIHQIVRPVQAITPIFNGFFAQMHRTFGYGTRNPDDWWEHDVPMGRWDPSFIKA
jgi:reductive dehalogenase